MTMSGTCQGRITYGYNKMTISRSQMTFEQETESHEQICHKLGVCIVGGVFVNITTYIGQACRAMDEDRHALWVDLP